MHEKLVQDAFYGMLIYRKLRQLIDLTLTDVNPQDA